MGRRKKLLVIITHPIQYFAPLYRRISDRGVVDISVVYLTDAGAVAHYDPGFGREVTWDVPLLEGYQSRVLQPDSGVTNRGFWQRSDPDLRLVLQQERPDWILLDGYASRMNWEALFWARLNRVSVLYRSDSNGRHIGRGFRTTLKSLVVRRFFQRVDCFLSPSEANELYLTYFGADRRRVRFMPFAIDLTRFGQQGGRSGPPRPYDFLWVGKLTPRKRPEDFVSALALLGEWELGPIKARITGDGPLKSALSHQAENLLPPNISLDWTGFINQQEMPRVMCEANTFMFTSEREPYGLVATEAAACGLALIVAENIGCVGTKSSARPGVNALTYPVGDVKELAARMARLLRNREALEAMQKASLAVAADHDIDRAAEVIEDVVYE